MREIEQPSHLARPDLKDQIAWSTVMPIHSQWLREVAHQLGLDTQKIILGDALGNIIGDDANAFFFQEAYMPDLVDLSKKLLYIRMDWEVTVPELPDDIKSQIGTVRTKLDTYDWTIQNQYYQAKNLWTKKVHNYTRHQLALNKYLREAAAYELQTRHIWSPYWQMFLYGESFTG